jgi:hypothetical protein
VSHCILCTQSAFFKLFRNFAFFITLYIMKPVLVLKAAPGVMPINSLYIKLYHGPGMDLGRCLGLGLGLGLALGLAPVPDLALALGLAPAPIP